MEEPPPIQIDGRNQPSVHGDLWTTPVRAEVFESSSMAVDFEEKSVFDQPNQLWNYGNAFSIVHRGSHFTVNTPEGY